MASSLLRTQPTIFRLLTTRNIPSFNAPHRLQCHQQRLQFSNFFKRGKDCDAAAAPEFMATTSMGLNGFVSWYLGMVKTRPVLTKSVTCSLIYIAADLSSQTIAMSSLGTYDYLRTLRMAGYGFILLGPTLHYWFNLMSKFFPNRDLLSTAKKMALGQSVYGPIMTITFFTMNAALQGEHYTDIVSRLKRDLLPTLLNGVMYWPVCDFITFRFVPVHLQPLVSNGFSYIWTIYLTYMASLEKAI